MGNFAHAYFYNEQNDINVLFDSIIKLEKLTDCKDIVTELINKIENIFSTVKEEEYSKKVNDIIYYPNGLIKNKTNGEAIIASPWVSSTIIKEKSKKERRHKFLALGESILKCQMKVYTKAFRANNRYYENSDLSTLLSKIEMANNISDKDKELLNLNVGPYNLAKCIAFLRSFFKTNKNGLYLTDKNCEDILLIYKKLNTNDYFDYDASKTYYHVQSNNLILQLEDYIASRQ